MIPSVIGSINDAYEDYRADENCFDMLWEPNSEAQAAEIRDLLTTLGKELPAYFGEYSEFEIGCCLDSADMRHILIAARKVYGEQALSEFLTAR